MEGIEGTAERRQRLQQLMDERRLQLRLKWTGVADRAGMSVQNVLRIRNGQRITMDAAYGLEDALQWERGAIEGFITSGVEPRPKAKSGGRLHPVNWTPEKEAVFRRIEAFLASEGEDMEEADLEEAAARYLQKHHRETPARDNYQ